MWQHESWRSGEERERKKERLIQLLHESFAAPCLYLRDVFLCHAFNVSQLDFTGNEYIFS